MLYNVNILIIPVTVMQYLDLFFFYLFYLFIFFYSHTVHLDAVEVFYLPTDAQ